MPTFWTSIIRRIPGIIHIYIIFTVRYTLKTFIITQIFRHPDLGTYNNSSIRMTITRVNKCTISPALFFI